jgi:hypothetical protein
MEDYDSNPKEYMRSIYKFLDLREPTEDQWKDILFEFRANVNPIKKVRTVLHIELSLYLPYELIAGGYASRNRAAATKFFYAIQSASCSYIKG